MHFNPYLPKNVSGFEQESFYLKIENFLATKESFFHWYIALREMDHLDSLCQNPDIVLGNFWQRTWISGIM
ncbi:hypothetical protein AG4045_021521 [Apium graveolens]|uniref:Uncharacterized protein n=1 Tax=Apium graveolens TaxID=4045 RepID=A0A6L5BCH0_APIGR|nr:hypothetical protein AG4045_021521 [Apium graveolens]